MSDPTPATIAANLVSFLNGLGFDSNAEFVRVATHHIEAAIRQAEERGAQRATPREMSWEEFQTRFPHKGPTPELRAAAKKYREITDGRVMADSNECGIWCPKCGAHLREPE